MFRLLRRTRLELEGRRKLGNHWRRGNVAPQALLHSVQSRLVGLSVGQQALEPTCLGVLALRRSPTNGFELALYRVENMQNRDRSWPAFVGDEPEGCWATSLAVLTLMANKRRVCSRGCGGCSMQKGRAANWFWRWKFRTLDKSAQSTQPSTGGTGFLDRRVRLFQQPFVLIAVLQVKNCAIKEAAAVVERIEMGISMLLDRVCPGGGMECWSGVRSAVRRLH
jgi:hypothetical protein